MLLAHLHTSKKVSDTHSQVNSVIQKNHFKRFDLLIETLKKWACQAPGSNGRVETKTIFGDSMA